MANKALVPCTDQESMLVVNEQTGVVHARDFTAHEATASEALAVNTQERSDHLQNLLKALSNISRRYGLARAAVSSYRPFRESLEGRYGSKLGTVVEGALDKTVKLQKHAKDEFNNAFGLTAMIGSGLITKEQAETMADHAYGQFERRFEGPNGNLARKSLTEKLQDGDKVRDMTDEQFECYQKRQQKAKRKPA